jgi:hypothetical protein
MIRAKYAAWPILAGALLSPVLMDCGAAKDLEELSSGCNEINQGADVAGTLKVDANVKAMVVASAELKSAAARIKVDVKAACVDVCNRLEIEDTWSSFGDDDKSISNSEGTGACDKAAHEINAVMGEAKASAHFALVVTEPKCTVDTDFQASCEAGCKVDAVCKPGEIDVVTRCDPAQLSVQCSGVCQANAVCEGTTEVVTQCEGTCSGRCKGSCEGPWVAEDGTMASEGSCDGKCRGKCKGTCSGECKVTTTTGISCGASASCRGGCTGEYTAPKCETELKRLPPECHADTHCEVCCSTQARSHVQCTPPTVNLLTDVRVSAKVSVLKEAVEANFPKLVLAARTQGPILQKALKDMGDAASAFVNTQSNLTGKSAACAAAAGQATATAFASIDVSVKGSAKVHDSCSDNES